jgi:hypothetical protein
VANLFQQALKTSLDDVMNPEKTKNGRLIGGMNCHRIQLPKMMDTQKAFGKVDKRQGYHLIISFKEGEVSPDTDYEITKRVVKDIWAGSMKQFIVSR